MGYQLGDTVAPFTLPRVEGGELTVDPTTAPATVVVFTANHCPYALAWHERIQQVARDYRDREVLLVQINANNQMTHPTDSTEVARRSVRISTTSARRGKVKPLVPYSSSGSHKRVTSENGSLDPSLGQIGIGRPRPLSCCGA